MDLLAKHKTFSFLCKENENLSYSNWLVSSENAREKLIYHDIPKLFGCVQA